MTLKNIISGFKVTGVFPVDIFAIKLPEDTIKPALNPEKLAVKSGLAYTPLYSPVHSTSTPKQNSLKPSGSSTLQSCNKNASSASVDSNSYLLVRSLSEDNLSTGYSNSSYCRVSLSRNTLEGVLSTSVAPNKLPTKRLITDCVLAALFKIRYSSLYITYIVYSCFYYCYVSFQLLDNILQEVMASVYTIQDHHNEYACG